MKYGRGAISHRIAAIGCALLFAGACGAGSGELSGSAGTAGTHTAGQAGTTGTAGTGAGSAGTTGVAGTTGTAGTTGAAGTTGTAGTSGAAGTTGVAGTGPSTGTAGAAGQPSGTAGAGGHAAGTTGSAGAGQSGGHAGGGQSAGSTGTGGALVSNCVGKAWPTADPTLAGPFEVAADKGVGPAAGTLPDPVYMNVQQHFNVYRPKNLADSGYCHPILVWNNGHTDNPEPNPPNCVVAGGKYCGTYPVLINQLASHGFVVIASLSTIVSQGDPLPNIVGLNWLLQQAEDPTSPYYHHLDTAHIGALGHSEGGLATWKEASDPRISVVASVSGSTANPGLHGPALLFCGGKDTTVPCSNVMTTYTSITTQPAMLVDNLSADHGSWLFQSGAKGPDVFGLTAWFRVHLMGDTGNRKVFYGPSCTLCTDSRVQVMRNSVFPAQ